MAYQAHLRERTTLSQKMGPLRERFANGAVLGRDVEHCDVAPEAIRELTGRPPDPAAHVEDAVGAGDLRHVRQGKCAREAVPVVVVDRRELSHGNALRVDALSARSSSAIASISPDQP